MFSKRLLLGMLWMSVVLDVKAQKQDPAITQKVDLLLNRMTLEEKIGQLNQYSGKALTGPATAKSNDLQTEIRNGWVGSVLNVKGTKNTREVQSIAMQSRLKIPLLFSLDVIHGYYTTFPIPLAEAASWDMEAIKLSAHLAAREAAASGIHWTFAPMVDIARDPRWGRIMEGAGEDPYLGSCIAEARVRGFQGKVLGDTDAVMATAKHFAAYGAATAGRDYSGVEMSDHELWQTYLPPFRAAAKAGAATFMNSFNTLNGIPATGNSYLLRNILKGKWHYTGFVVSDWNSIGEMVTWGYANDVKDAALKAITAGCDIDMEGGAYRKNLISLVKEGKVPVALINEAVKRILYQKYQLGLFDDPYKFCDEKRESLVLNDKKSRLAARSVAEKSIVLLKNDGAILPLNTNLKTIAVIGPLAKAKRDMAAAWNVNQDTTAVVSLYDGISLAIRGRQTVLYAKGGSVMHSSQQDIAEAVSIASQADIVVMALGESFDMSGESKSRADIALPGNQEDLFEAVAATGKPVIVTIMGGRPLIFNRIANKAQSILYTWWLGSEAGNAIADVIFGKYNPSGKLPVSFPRSMGQIPIFYSQTNTGRPYNNEPEKLYLSSYIDEQNSPRYAFGYGLSYTTFGYSELKLDKNIIFANDSVTISFSLTNTGRYAGEEVAQLYLRDEVASVVRPLKELKKFIKVQLQPGESRIVHFVLGNDDLSFYDAKLNWIVEPGVFRIMIGSASDDIRASTAFTLKK
ncbi:glycoside hydrolase family 3 N-terminal domain-containing protein [Mucilaginibacter paludis]|uniref:Glycoside hydrolase family 3 domain protein n=1 Tax=Mucilaginibacter paludis DSM 18603 TaxID=714943 RepID=H1YDR7_9SPHI|nr:glycoside hydrolase family 3 N-terminal domain-containing protein [Mucilaginibacter paludis]EHQ30756.1 glycoside hydrolase family 3 domain protein [Mucilaginibacter paludis DSM 18603]